jgi:hypothetical protein
VRRRDPGAARDRHRATPPPGGRPRRRAGTGRDDDRATPLAMVLPYVPVSFGLVVTVTFVVRDGPLDPVLYLLGVAVMVLVMARQFVALRDNSVLTRELLGRSGSWPTSPSTTR